MEHINGRARNESFARQVPWGRALVAIAWLLVMRSAGAEILLLDQGDSGIALSNVLDSQVRPPVAERVPEAVAATVLARLDPSAQSKTSARERLAPLVTAAAVAHGLPVALLTAVIEVESNFDAAAVSPSGAVGLMQLMPQTARYLGVANARDPAANIDGGARYLKKLLDRFDNNLHLALAAYNAGPSTVQRSGAIPPYAETQRYVPKVIGRYHRLQSGLRD